MSEIKSALELALERTADVKGDKAKLEAHESRQKGMRLAGRFIDDQSVDVKGEIKRMDRSQQTSAREGFYHVLLSHLALPTQESDVQRLQTVQKGLRQIIKDRNLVDGLMDQVIQYMQQYLDTKNQLTERLRQQ
ncbi:MAG: DUF6657 family protein, partial [Spirochaetota bacterium]